MTKSSGTILDGERRPEGLAHGSSGQGAGMAPRTPRLLLIDNYDSFTYNLVQAFLVLGADVHVYRNDAMTVEEALAFAPSHLCISPGPGTPYDAGTSMDMIRAFAGRLPVLGVCLGHQSIVEVFGGKVVRAGRLMHGKTSIIQHDGHTLFEGLPQPCEVGRYHSLIAAPETLPPELEVTAQTAEGEIMGVRHRTLMVEGVQFHPESILTPDGPALMKNFLGFSGGHRGRGSSAVGASDAVSA
jgi:anthranilate synthase/aminodeoxychorismate synthase-like glutamine amidotransferase